MFKSITFMLALALILAVGWVGAGALYFINGAVWFVWGALFSGFAAVLTLPVPFIVSAFCVYGAVVLFVFLAMALPALVKEARKL